MENIELRFNPTTIFNDENGEMTISGYINQTEQYSHVLGQRKKFREKIQKGCFQRALEKATNINLLYEHNPKAILSSTKGGHMTLEEDEIGLKITAKIIPTSLGKDVHQLIKAKVVNGCSFGFRMLKDSWKKASDGMLLRTIEEMELFEVTVCENGAYPQGLVSARGINVIEDVEIPDEIEAEVEDRAMDEEVEIEERATDKTDELLGVITELLKQNNELIQNLKATKEEPKQDVIETPDTPTVENISDDKVPEENNPVEETVVEEDNKEESTVVEEPIKEEVEEEVTVEPTAEETAPVVEENAEVEEVQAVDLSAYKNVLSSMQKENLDEN